jgi:NAD+ kinase
MGVDVVLVVHGGREDARALAAATESSLAAEGLEVVAVGLDQARRERDERALEGLAPSLFVSLGGDGTFLRTARHAHGADRPVLGVNFGRVGYLLDLPPDGLDRVIVETLGGQGTIELRAGLEISMQAGEGPEERYFAVNELSAEKTVPGHVVRLAATIDGEPFLTYSADGVLLSTPTGSTAYNLSAGGPVLAPHLDALVMTPVAPHFVIDRSVVLGGDQTVVLDVVGERPVVCVIDGMSVATLQPGDQLRARRHPRWLKVVVLADRGVGRRLRESLRQGHE